MVAEITKVVLRINRLVNLFGYISTIFKALLRYLQDYFVNDSLKKLNTYPIRKCCHIACSPARD